MKASLEDNRLLSPAAPTRRRLLVVDDEEDMRDMARAMLEEDGWDVSTASSGSEAIDILKQELFDMVLLDLRLPIVDGFEVLRRARKFCSIPIVALSALSAVEDRKRFLDLGGNDYITKPFTTQELRFRTWAAIREGQNEKSNAHKAAKASSGRICLADGYLTIDLEARRVSVEGNDVAITGKEYYLLQELALHKGAGLGSRELLSTVWGPEYSSDTGLIYVAIAHLRAKIEPDPSQPRYIVTIPRFGYRFQMP